MASPRPTPSRAGKKRLEGLFGVGGSDAAPRIGHANAHGRAGARGQAVRLDADAPALGGQRLAGVLQDVEKGLAELIGLSAHGGKVRRQKQFIGGALRRLFAFAQRGEEFLEQWGEAHGNELDFARRGEQKHLVDDGFAAQGFAMQNLEILAALIAGRGGAQEEFGIGRDHAEGIIEFVGDSGGDFAEAGEVFRAQQAFAHAHGFALLLVQNLDDEPGQQDHKPDERKAQQEGALGEKTHGVLLEGDARDKEDRDENAHHEMRARRAENRESPQHDEKIEQVIFALALAALHWRVISKRISR
jgi:hypothetical protein